MLNIAGYWIPGAGSGGGSACERGYGSPGFSRASTLLQGCVQRLNADWTMVGGLGSRFGGWLGHQKARWPAAGNDEEPSALVRWIRVVPHRAGDRASATAVQFAV